MISKRPVVLCILDGWGISAKSDYNAIHHANPSFYNYLLSRYPHSQLDASGSSVGLPVGQMGNSEVGHMTIGSGKIIEQDLARVSKALADKQFFNNSPQFQSLVKNLKTNNSSCHLIGLASDGGVHSHIEHALSVIEFLISHSINIHFHMICDGRDTIPKSAITYYKTLGNYAQSPHFRISTVSGRYYAMDRDNRYERTKKAYNAITSGKGTNFDNPLKYIEDNYQKNITDEFIAPSSHIDYSGIQEKDALLFFNFRPDRVRQLVSALTNPAFNFFNTKNLNLSNSLTFTEYSEDLSEFNEVIFKKKNIEHPLGRIISDHDLRQLRAAETEKYPHVTYFFNGGAETIFEKEERILIPSPQVSTYDLKPEMSAVELTDAIIKNAANHDFVLVNYANADMVGHTGNFRKTISSITTIDDCLKKLYQRIVEELNATLVITSDHGNVEQMFDEERQQPLTSHTTNPVPLIIANAQILTKNIDLKNGHLYDIAPTILSLLGIESNTRMDGKNLINYTK